MKVRMYSRDGCPFCDKSRVFFEAHEIEFEEIKMNNTSERQEWYKKVSSDLGKSINTVPQIFIGDQHVGGYSELVKNPDVLILTRTMLDSSVTYKPFVYPWAVDIARTHEKVHWVEDEVELTEDVNDWKLGRVTDEEKEFITNVLRLFTQSDVAVGENYYDQFLPRVRNNELRNMLGSFAAREAIHQRAYALLNDTLGLPDSEFHTFLEYKEMSDKIDFMQSRDPKTQKGLALCMAQSVFNEGVMLFASFAALLNFQLHGKMLGMCKVVEWSVRDETIHVQGIAKMFREFVREHPRVVTDEFKKDIYQMARDVVALEDKFIDLLYQNTSPTGLDKDDLKKYIRYISDRRLIQLGLKPNFGIKDNPLGWLEDLLNASDHTNFFENRVTEYSVGGLKGEWNLDNFINREKNK